jgi:hypothetical protein
MLGTSTEDSGQIIWIGVEASLGFARLSGTDLCLDQGVADTKEPWRRTIVIVRISFQHLFGDRLHRCKLLGRRVYRRQMSPSGHLQTFPALPRMSEAGV